MRAALTLCCTVATPAVADVWDGVKDGDYLLTPWWGHLLPWLAWGGLGWSIMIGITAFAIRETSGAFWLWAGVTYIGGGVIYAVGVYWGASHPVASPTSAFWPWMVMLGVETQRRHERGEAWAHTDHDPESDMTRPRRRRGARLALRATALACAAAVGAAGMWGWMQMEAAPKASRTSSTAPATGGALARYDDNRNGRITCKEARRHGIAPVRRGHPAYAFMRDGDGTVCE